MFRFSVNGEDWILRFSPHLQIETDERQEIMMSLLHIGNQLSNFSHGEAFIMFSKKIGAIVFEVERIPSFILTVSNIIEENHWYIQDTTIQLKRKL